MSKSFISGLILIHFVVAYSNAQEIDTVLIRQFTYSDYNGGTVNYTGLAGPDGILYFGNSEGLLVYDGSEWKKIIIGDDSGVSSLLISGDTLYVGGTDEIGFVLLTGESDLVYQSFIPQIANPHLLDDVWQIVKTKDGIYFQSYNMLLWYNGHSFKQIDISDAYIFNFRDNLLVSGFYDNIKILEKDSIINSLATPDFDEDAVYSIVKSKVEGEFLVFTSVSGVFKLKTDPLEISYWDSPISAQLKIDGLYNAIEYQDSLIICSTWEQGLLVFNKEGEILRRIAIDQGIPSRDLREIFIDELGNIWVPAGTGLYQLRLSIGPGGPDFHAKTIIKSLETEIGKVVNPESIFHPQYVAFDFTTPGFNKEQLEYAFYLEGYDEDWTEWSKIYRKEYTNLGNSTYIFHVKARLAGSDIESDEASTRFTIILPFYLRPIFYVLSFLVLMAVIYIIMRIRTSELKRLKIELEKVVATRTEELVKEREKLKDLNSELQIANTELDHFVYRSSHDLIAPLKSLRGLMAITRLETKEAPLLKYIGMMETSVLKLEKFINSIIDYSVNTKSAVELGAVNIDDIVDEICEEIEFFDKYSSINIIKELSQSELRTDVKRLKIVLVNLITNAIKYHKIDQQSPWIKISSKRLEHHYQIEIADNGIGIEPGLHSKIFDMFYRASTASDGSGLGLYIVKDTMNKLNGTVSISSSLGKGSTFTLLFPSD